MHCLQTANRCSCRSEESTSGCGWLVSRGPFLPLLSPLACVCVCACLCTKHKQEITFAYTARHCRSITLYSMYLKHGFIVCLLKQCGFLDALHAWGFSVCTCFCTSSNLFARHTSRECKKRCRFIIFFYAEKDSASLSRQIYTVQHLLCNFANKAFAPDWQDT